MTRAPDQNVVAALAVERIVASPANEAIVSAVAEDEIGALNVLKWPLLRSIVEFTRPV